MQCWFVDNHVCKSDHVINTIIKIILNLYVFNLLLKRKIKIIPVGYSKGQSVCVSQKIIKTLLFCQRIALLKKKSK